MIACFKTKLFATKRRRLLVLVCLSSSLAGCALDTTSDARDLTADVSGAVEEIRNGTPITSAQTLTYLPVTVNARDTRCSGTLLTNDIVITNEHCAPQGSTNTLQSATFNGQTSEISRVFPHPSNVPSSFGVDVLLFQVDPPFTVDGSRLGFRRKLWPRDLRALRGNWVTMVGEGSAMGFEINGFRVGSIEERVAIPPPPPGIANSGAVEDRLWLRSEGDWQTEPGDSGSGVFGRVDAPVLAGIHTGNDGARLGSSVPQSDARHAVAITGQVRDFVRRVAYDRVYRGMGCGRANTYYADFTGNGQDDIICHDPRSGSRRVRITALRGGFSSWLDYGRGWCNHRGARLLTGDFDGDDRADLLCTDQQGRKWIDYGRGGYTGTEAFWDARWCHTNTIHVGDFDGDGRDDLLCHAPSRGLMWLDRMDDGEFAGTDAWWRTQWCSHSGSKVYPGRFSGDGQTDLLCHDRSGHLYLQHAGRDGVFREQPGMMWSRAAYWCALFDVHVGDFDGDRLDDLLCHDPKGGGIWIDYRRDNFRGTEYTESRRWCAHSSAQFAVASMDANTDRNRAAEFVCHDEGGDVWVAHR